MSALFWKSANMQYMGRGEERNGEAVGFLSRNRGVAGSNLTLATAEATMGKLFIPDLFCTSFCERPGVRYHLCNKISISKISAMIQLEHNCWRNLQIKGQDRRREQDERTGSNFWLTFSSACCFWRIFYFPQKFHPHKMMIWPIQWRCTWTSYWSLKNAAKILSK